MSEVAEMLGVTRQRVHELRGRPDFPAPRWVVGRRAMWLATDIETFVASWPRKVGRPRAD